MRRIIQLFTIIVLINQIMNDEGNPAWNKIFKCGGGTNCLGLDPSADGCYYNRVKKIGWCYHIVDKKGTIYFAGKSDNYNNSNRLRLMQTSPTPCRLDVCNQCESACYRSDCGTPEECNKCTCFLGANSNSTVSSYNWCCPLPADVSILNEDPTNIDLTFLFEKKEINN